MPKLVKDSFVTGILATIIASLFLASVGVFASDHIINAEQELKIDSAVKVGEENKTAIEKVDGKVTKIGAKVTKIEADISWIISAMKGELK